MRSSSPPADVEGVNGVVKSGGDIKTEVEGKFSAVGLFDIGAENMSSTSTGRGDRDDL